MRLSDRISGIVQGGDDGWGVFYKARALKAAGAEITELTIGEHDRRTDPAILRAMDESARGGNTGYAAIPGSAPLRAAIAERVARRSGVATGPENVIVTPGGQAALFAAHLACLDAGDTALYLDPYYATYPGTLRAVGARARAVLTRAEDDFQPRAAGLEAAAQGARSLLVNTPNNPTGVVYDRRSVQAIADCCRRHDLWLISDEVYDSQIWEGAHISPRSLEGMRARTLVVGSFSKSHAMTGSRIGWIVAEPEVIDRLTDLSVCTTYGVPGFIQDAALFALNQGERLEQEVAAPFRRRREIARQVLAGATALRLIPPGGAMYLMLDIRATGLSGQEFALRLLEAEAIAVMPGESFGAAAAGHLRVAMTVDDDRFADALKRLAGFAAALAG